MISNNDRAWTCINRWRRRGYDGQVEIFETVMADNERLRATLREWEGAMNRLSMRVGLTAQDIANELNPVMDSTRAVLEEN